MLKNYNVTIRITDLYRKPDNLQGEKTDKRFFWEEKIEAKKFENEKQAELAILLHYKQNYSSKKYNIEIISIRENLILPEEKKIILPGDL